MLTLDPLLCLVSANRQLGGLMTPRADRCARRIDLGGPRSLQTWVSWPAQRVGTPLGRRSPARLARGSQSPLSQGCKSRRAQREPAKRILLDRLIGCLFVTRSLTGKYWLAWVGK